MASTSSATTYMVDSKRLTQPTNKPPPERFLSLSKSLSKAKVDRAKRIKPMSSYMYILECADGSYYTGSTKHLDKRLWQHQNGEGANYTKSRLPVKLVYCEPFDRVEDAFHREKQVQGWHRQKKQALIEENYDKLIEFSRNYTEYRDDEIQ